MVMVMVVGGKLRSIHRAERVMSVSVCQPTLKLNESDCDDLISPEDKERQDKTKRNSSLVELIRSLLSDC